MIIRELESVLVSVVLGSLLLCLTRETKRRPEHFVRGFQALGFQEGVRRNRVSMAGLHLNGKQHILMGLWKEPVWSMGSKAWAEPCLQAIGSSRRLGLGTKKINLNSSPKKKKGLNIG